MIEKIKLSELEQNLAPDPFCKIPLIKPDGGLEYSHIFRILGKNATINESYTLESGKPIIISATIGIIRVKSSLGEVVFMGGYDFTGLFLVANNNYYSNDVERIPGKINIYGDEYGETIRIENYTNAQISIDVDGIAIRGFD